MKKVLNYLIIGLILTSCSINKKEVIILKTLDQFDTQEENERLGGDILNYMFPVLLQQEFPDFTQAVLKNITWQYFIQKNNKQVSFRLILSNEALAEKNKITSFFKKTVNEQIERQVKDRELFAKAVVMTIESLQQLDNKEFDLFWEKTSELMRSMTTKEYFIESLKDKEGIIGIGGKRVYHSKQYYKTMPGTDQTDFFVVNFTYENNKNIMEQITYQLIDNELKIAGHIWRIPNLKE